MQSVLRLYNEEPLRLREKWEEQELVVRQLTASKDMNSEAEDTVALETVTRRQPVKTQQGEKT
jgi:hypothetical protein